MRSKLIVINCIVEIVQILKVSFIILLLVCFTLLVFCLQKESNFRNRSLSYFVLFFVGKFGIKKRTQILKMSIISIHIGDTADWIGSYIWNIRDESTKEIDSCANIYYDESDQEQLEKPKCVLLDSGDWNSSIHEKVDDLDCVWDGNTDIVQQDYKRYHLLFESVLTFLHRY